MAASAKACAGAVVLLGIALTVEVRSQSQTELEVASLTRERRARMELIDSYCVTCHSASTKSGGVVLQAIDPVASGNPALWEKIIRKVSSGEMPPPGRVRPDAATSQQFTAALTR